MGGKGGGAEGEEKKEEGNSVDGTAAPFRC